MGAVCWCGGGGALGDLLGGWTDEHPNSGSPEQCVHCLAVPGRPAAASMDTAGVQGLLLKPDRRLESPSCPYGTLMKTRTLCPEAWASLGRHGGQRAARRPSRSETGWDPPSTQEPCQVKQSRVCQKNTEKQVSATTGEQRVSHKTQTEAHTKGRPPGSTTGRRTGCAPRGGGGQWVSSLPAPHVLGVWRALPGGGHVLIIHGQQMQRGRHPLATRAVTP